jgi:hypothetical protein
LAGPTGKTEPVAVCLDADILIAGLLSRTGASHAILILGEIGLLRLVLPEAVVDEVRRNLTDKLSETLPLFEEFLRSVPVRSIGPRPRTGKGLAPWLTRRTCRSSPRRSVPARRSW